MTSSTQHDRRRFLGSATFLLGLGVLLGSAPPGAANRRASDIPDADVVHMVTETLPPVNAEDRGSILTHGTGTAPVLSATELDILADARAAVARNGSVVPGRGGEIALGSPHTGGGGRHSEVRSTSSARAFERR